MSWDYESNGPSTNYAMTEQRFIRIASPIGRSLAQLWFGLDNSILEAIVGRYVRGKRKGQLRGSLSYKFCVHGGWIPYQGVQPRGVVQGSQIIVDSFTGKPL